MRAVPASPSSRSQRSDLSPVRVRVKQWARPSYHSCHCWQRRLPSIHQRPLSVGAIILPEAEGLAVTVHHAPRPVVQRKLAAERRGEIDALASDDRLDVRRIERPGRGECRSGSRPEHRRQRYRRDGQPALATNPHRDLPSTPPLFQWLRYALDPGSDFRDGSGQSAHRSPSTRLIGESERRTPVEPAAAT